MVQCRQRLLEVAIAVDDGGRAVIAFHEERLLALAVTRAIVVD